MILGQLFRGFRLERVPSHVHNRDRTHSHILVPKMQLNEDVRLVVYRGVDMLARLLLKICTVLLDTLQKE